MMQKILFIVNPVSGGKDKSTVLSAVGRHLDTGRFRYEVVQTDRAGQAETLAHEADADIVVAVGGDGTVSEVARGLMDSDKALGILPCGSGDGLALHLGISRDPGRAVRSLCDGDIVRIDTGLFDTRPFFCTAGVGLDAAVSLDFARSGQRGLKTYIDTAWEDWKHFKPDTYTIETDGGSWSGEAVFVTVANANQWGNRARIAPDASLRDGLLDITVVKPFSTLEIPELARLLMTGHAKASRRVESLRCKRARIVRSAPGPAHLDGDPLQAGVAVEFAIRPGSLRVVVPAKRKDKI